MVASLDVGRRIDMRLASVVFIAFCVVFTPSGFAQRIKDVASIQGVRSNQLVGYGLVVGLPGTGEQSPFTEQSFRTMLTNFGISLDANTKPKINDHGTDDDTKLIKIHKRRLII